jgi:DNA-binding NtrC family response regulator
MKNKIVLIDDELKLLKALKRGLEIEGHEVFDFPEPYSALEFIQKRDIDLVVSDIRMNGMTGIELLSEVTSLKPNLPFILMTAYSSVDTAVTAVKLGASDYLLKPFELDDFKNAVSKTLDKSAKKESLASEQNEKIIGSSKPITKIHELIEKVADTDGTILVTGESGTGKELVARAIHNQSLRAKKNFVPVNCSAIPESLFESEMFGHLKGSFTNAYSDKAGLFKEAEGGTLFLDEIGDLALSSQAKLLRVLQDGTYNPVGSASPRKANVRIIAATNRKLEDEVKEGKFREDLLYRINVVEIELPPLRKRLDDTKDLAKFFINKFATRHNRDITDATEEVFEALKNYNWPGNIRQLENTIERAVIMKRSGTLQIEDISLPESSSNEIEIESELPLQDAMNKIEEKLIKQALEKAAWNYSKAASILGVTRQNLHYKLKKYGFSKDE